MVAYVHRACWVYLRGSSSSGKSVCFLIPLAGVRQRGRGSRAEMLDVSGREEWEWNWVTEGVDRAAHQRLTEQTGDEWSNAAALLMNPQNHSCPPVFPCAWKHDIYLPLGLRSVVGTSLDCKDHNVPPICSFQNRNRCKSCVLIGKFLHLWQHVTSYLIQFICKAFGFVTLTVKLVSFPTLWLFVRVWLKFLSLW